MRTRRLAASLPRILCAVSIPVFTSVCAGGSQTCALRLSVHSEDGVERARCRIASYDGTAAAPSTVYARTDGHSVEIPVTDVPRGGGRQVVLEVSCDGYTALRSGPHSVTAGSWTCGDANLGRIVVRRLDARVADHAPR
jgi:hypothetical protein